MLSTITVCNTRPGANNPSACFRRSHPVRMQASRSASLVVHARGNDAPAVVITGASTGLGAATSERMARNGWLVFAGVRSQEDADRIRKANGDLSIEPVILDVTSQDSIKEAVEVVENSVGEKGIKGLVNNAGIGKYFGPVEIMPIEQQQAVFDVNYFGVIRASKGFLGLLRQGGEGGRVVNIGSMSGRFPFPMFGPYTASKHALEAMSDCLRWELGECGIQVALVEAGPVKTPIWEKALGNLDDIIADIPEELKTQYKPMMNGIRSLAEESQRKGVEPDVVVDVIQHALTSKTPRARYIVGNNTALYLFIKKIVPDRILDKVIRRIST